MKKISLFLAVFLLLGVYVTGTTRASSSTLLEDCAICDLDMSQYNGPLTAEEVQGLLLALNDEYRAWAVYDQVISDFGAVRPFVNIRRSEGKHVKALLPLFRKYNVPIPANPWLNNPPTFESVSAACAAGVEGELLNSALYDKLFTSTERQEIIRVYQSLQRASDEKHLPAFQRCGGGRR
jgi:hypothetical protein